ncbi:hypothetical protein [Vibrio sp. TRT 29B02]|uniref:hypothetical protein n=1 Tax=Vibrio sp. TRT 29B02 TaxID=3418508 RepID=UPI003CF22AD9
MSNQAVSPKNQASLKVTEDGLFITGKSINLHSTPSPTNPPIIIKDGSISIFPQATADKGDYNG